MTTSDDFINIPKDVAAYIAKQAVTEYRIGKLEEKEENLHDRIHKAENEIYRLEVKAQQALEKAARSNRYLFGDNAGSDNPASVIIDRMRNSFDNWQKKIDANQNWIRGIAASLIVALFIFLLNMMVR